MLLSFFCLLVVTSSRAQPAPVTVVDTLFVYTPEARTGAGGSAKLIEAINQAVREANFVFQNSRVNVRIRLIRALPVSYAEHGSISVDIDRLQNPSDGLLDQVHLWREKYRADLVCMINEGGYDWYFYGLQGPSPTNAFSILRRPFLTGQNYLPVVLSFNFGCQLERPFANSEAEFPYAYGYTFTTPHGPVSTVDAFTAGRLPFFSNPEILFDGVPAGIPDEADNARALNEMASIVGTFRGPLTTTLPPTITITEPADGAIVPFGNLKIAASANDPDGAVKRVDFYAGSTLIGTASGGNPITLWRKIPGGQHSLTAVAIDNQGAMTHSAPIQIDVRASNDDFANRATISGVRARIRANNQFATAELLEPAHWPGTAANHSLWWSWTAPYDGVFAISTEGSDLFNIVAVYEGEALDSLTPVATSVQSVVTELLFEARAGVTYQIAVDSYNIWQFGNVVLNLFPAPVPENDHFGSRQILSGSHRNVEGSNQFASREEGEPYHYVSDSGIASLWYSWTAPTDGSLSLNLADLGTWAGYRLLSVFTGNELTNLSLITYGTIPSAGQLKFDVSAGSAYQIAVSCSDHWTGLPARTKFRLGLDFTGAPANDDFAQRQTITGSKVTRTSSNVAATMEPGEPQITSDSYQNSIWWSWTAPASGRVHLVSSNGHGLGVFTGSNVTGLTAVASGSDFTFDSIAGTSYAIAADGAEGTVVLDLTFSTVQLLEPAEGSQWIAGANIPLNASTTSFDGNVVRVDFFADELLLGFVGAPPYQMFWTNGNPGNYVLRAVAVDSNGNHRESNSRSLQILPANDDFADRFELASDATEVRVWGRNATLEPGEPLYDDPILGSSVWFSWTTLTPGRLTLARPLTYPYVRISCLTGSSLESLVLLTNTPRLGNGTLSSSVTFDVLPDTEYQISVNGDIYDAQDMPLTIVFHPRPPNDDFTNRHTLNGTNTILTGPTGYGSREPEEPTASGESVWWTWTAPTNGVAEFSGLVSDVNVWVAIFTGNSLSNLTLIDRKLLSPFLPERGLRFRVQAGESYQIALSRQGEYPETDWPVQLPFRFWIPPANDDFVNRFSLVGFVTVASGSTGEASAESGESGHAGFAPRASLWWTWTAPADGKTRLHLGAGTPVAFISIYTGDSLTNLTIIAENSTPHPFAFNAIAGTTYQIAVDNQVESIPDFELHMELTKVEIINPLSGTRVQEQTTVEIVARTVDVGGAVNQVEFFAGTNSLGTDSTAPFAVVWTNPVPGLHQLTCRATDEFQNTYWSEPVEITVFPANDLFDNRYVLSSAATNSWSASNLLAASEPNEYIPGGGSGKSLWWTWTAPSNGTVNINFSSSGFVLTGLPPAAEARGLNSIIIIGPPPPPPPLPPPGYVVGPLVSVFQGAAVSNLQLVASNTFRYCQPYCYWRVYPFLVFPVVGGQTYHLRFDGLNGSSGVANFDFVFTAAIQTAAAKTAAAPAGPAVQVDLSAMKAGGDLRLRLAGQPLRRVVVSVSRDLRKWTPVSTNTFTSETLEIFDRDAAKHPMRFYKAEYIE